MFRVLPRLKINFSQSGLCRIIMEECRLLAFTNLLGCKHGSLLSIWHGSLLSVCHGSLLSMYLGPYLPGSLIGPSNCQQFVLNKFQFGLQTILISCPINALARSIEEIQSTKKHNSHPICIRIVSYLGLPLCVGSIEKLQWGPVVERVERKLSS